MEWNIGKIVSKRADLTPDKACIIYEGNPITYKDFNDNVNRLANYLMASGLKKGDRIAVALLNCPESLEVYFAAAKLGLIYVPLNYRLAAPELKYQLDNSGSRLLVFHDSLLKNVETIYSSSVVEKDKFIYLESGIPDCPGCPEWAIEFNEAREGYLIDEPVLETPIDFNDPLCIMYTSGVTGEPKGAVLSHQQTYFKNFQVILYTDMRSNDRFLSQSPLFHSAGLFIASTPTFCRGGTVVMRQKFDPERFCLDIEEYRPTVILCLTSMWTMILESGKLDEIDTSSVRVVIDGGERTPPKMFDDLADRGIQIQNAYGQTENSLMMVMPREYIWKKMGSIGKPGFFTEVWIADKNGKKLPPGETGELVARGPVVMSGYWNMPEKTKETIVKGVLHTGDLAYMDEDGFFYIVDREKDMYRSGGENVYPAEVEKVLADHPKVLNISIIGVPDEKWGETGMAFVVLNKGETSTREELIDFLNGKVARYKFPTHFKFMDELPMTASGKIKKVELKKKYGVRLNK